jgi:hypothetical protein
MEPRVSSVFEHSVPLTALFAKAEAASVQISPRGEWVGWLARTSGVLNLFVAPLPLPSQDAGDCRPSNSIPGALQLTHEFDRDICFSFRFSRDDARILYLRETEHGSEMYHVFSLELPRPAGPVAAGKSGSVCMYVYTYVRRTYIHTYMQTYIHTTHTHRHIHTHTHTQACVCVCVCVCAYIHTYYMYIYTYYMYVHAYMHTCYVYIHTHTGPVGRVPKDDVRGWFCRGATAVATREHPLPYLVNGQWYTFS